jgi:hypothetical protein
MGLKDINSFSARTFTYPLRYQGRGREGSRICPNVREMSVLFTQDFPFPFPYEGKKNRMGFFISN